MMANQLPLYTRKCAQCKRELPLLEDFNARGGPRFVVVCEVCRERDHARRTRMGLGLVKQQHTESKAEMRVHLRLVEPYPVDVVRPRTRAECTDGPRPCPWVSCRHHLMLDVTDAGSLKYNFDDLEEMTDTCALDLAAHGGITLEETAKAMNLVRQRVQQIEEGALRRPSVRAALAQFKDSDHGERVSPRAAKRLTPPPVEPTEEAPEERDDSLPSFVEYGGEERWNARVYRAYVRATATQEEET